MPSGWWLGGVYARRACHTGLASPHDGLIAPRPECPSRLVQELGQLKME